MIILAFISNAYNDGLHALQQIRTENFKFHKHAKLGVMILLIDSM